MSHCCTPMHRPNAPIALVDLTAAGVQLRPFEAVTIVRELLLLVARGDVAGVPSAHVIKLSSAGIVSVEGPVAAGGRPVMRAAQLLDSLLPVSDLGKEFRVPGGLKLVVARALGTLDLPPFPSLDSFADALSRFAATDPAAAITNIVTSWSDLVGALPRPAVEVEVEPLPAAQVQPFVSTRTQDVRAHLAHEPLTVSDIRRARRATGLPLAAVSERSHIPIGMLRQLEWGYFVNWPTGNYGRTQLVRYARAAGLDEQLVVETLLPLIEVAERPALVPTRAAASVSAIVADPVADPDAAAVRPALPARPAAEAARPAPLVPRTVIDVEPDLEPAGGQVLQRTVASGNAGRRARAAALAALAIPALLAIGLLPLWWARSSSISMSELPSLVAKQVSGRPESTSPSTAATTRRSEPVGTATKPERGPERAPEPAAVAPTPPVQAPPQRRETTTGADAAQYQLASDRAFSPSFASAGTAVFYHAKESDSAPLMRADTDGSGEVLRITRIVDDSANNWHVRPSPDGKQIAFDSDRDGARGVYLADADGQRVRRVSGEGWAAVPSWSPDGGTLAFVREDPALPKVWNLWTLNLSSGETRQITRHKFGQLWGGSWFPDGRHIAYSHETRLVIHDLEDGTDRTFNTPIKGRLLRTPAVSPEGRRVVFQVLRNGTWLLELQNGSMRRILEDPTAEEYTWSPDGRRLAYHSKRSGVWGVWVMASR
jgi:Tol biopolymer transport system component